MEDLLGAMAISRSSLYHAFGSKQALFERCLERYAASLVTALEADLAAAPSGRAFIVRVFDRVADSARTATGDRGCLLGNSATEFGQREPQLAGPVAAGLRELTGVFAAAVARAQVEGEVSPDADTRAMATYLVGAMNGLRTMIKAGMDRRGARSMVVLILKAVQ